MSQIIISVGREFGSGGRYIADQLSKRFDIPLYDRHLITEIAQKTGMTEEEVNKYNEAPKIKILSRTVNGYSNSIEDNIAEMQFDIIDKKAKDGESFVVVDADNGRDTVNAIAERQDGAAGKGYVVTAPGPDGPGRYVGDVFVLFQSFHQR